MSRSTTALAPIILSFFLEATPAAEAPNFLLMIGDDMAVETLAAYGVGEDTADTPNLDALAAQGLRFDAFWSQPVCSPTRATLLTGQYGFRNGVGLPAVGISDQSWPRPDKPEGTSFEGVGVGGGDVSTAPLISGSEPFVNMERQGLADDAFAFPRALKTDPALGYELAAIGKWHLANDTNGGLAHPLRLGFDHYSGSIRGGSLYSYHSWSKVIDGVATDGKSGYGTSDVVDDAVAWLNGRDGETPWFLWVAFNAPHTPFHLPPLELLRSDAAQLDPYVDPDTNPHAYYKAMIEALDTEIGRLLSALEPDQRENTYVVFMGDNGTPNQAGEFAPFRQGRVKSTLYQGGIIVPFIVTGPGIEAGRVTKALANSVDLFATVLDLSGVDIDAAVPHDLELDSVSLAPVFHGNYDTIVRDFAYADTFGLHRSNTYRNQRTIRNQRYKLMIWVERGAEEFYDLEADPYERVDLLQGDMSDEARMNYEELKNRMAELRSR
jgi:arylsulfatase A-like enzyme